jgi:predicted SPOUT superfamily RNA methylase MTH1
METPQYLRKRLFKLKPELRYAGILPPLRTPHHPISNQTENLSIGEHREGAVISKVKHGSLIDIGVEKLVLIHKSQLPINSRVTVKVTELGKHPKAALASREEIKTYWGYRITVSKNLFGQFLKKRRFDLVIATSRQGGPIQKLKDKLFKRWKKSRRILVAFGAPSQGLYEIAAKEHLKLNNFADFVINTIPHQGTETVRTEEAIYASLAIFNLFTKDIKRNHPK